VTAATDAFPVRVMVTDVWDTIVLSVGAMTTVAELKREALARALKSGSSPAGDYVLKYRGAAVTDESRTLGDLGAGANAPFIILPIKRRPVS